MDLVTELLAALKSACETREGQVQVKFMGRWMLAREVEERIKQNMLS